MADTKVKVTKAPAIDASAPLDIQLAAKRTELLEARKNLGTTLQNPHQISIIRKDIARLLTKINATKGTK